MLNENGQSFIGLFKPWLSVQNAVLAIAGLFIISLFKLSSAELASWVQAFGSIAAILGAFMVSNRQLARQQEDRERDRRSKSEALYAVVETAAKYSESIRELVTDKRPIAPAFIMIWRDYLSHLTNTAIKGLEAIPAHELGSSKLVIFYGSVLADMVKVVSKIDSFVNRPSFSEQETIAFYSEISGMCQLVAHYWKEFQEAAKQV